MNYTIKVVYYEPEDCFGIVLVDNDTGKHLSQWQLDQWIKIIGGIEK